MALSTNWRDLGFTINKYVSEKDGNDVNAGTQALPRKTIESVIQDGTGTKEVQIRAGYYNEGDIVNVVNNNDKIF